MMIELMRRSIVGALTGLAVVAFVSGCASPAAQESFSGTVTYVREDRMTVQNDAGERRRVDTWEVCGDSTARTISVGDQVTVSALRDGLDFNAESILDADGQPLCAGGTTAAAGDSFSGTVRFVREDAMTVQNDAGEQRRFDTWEVCGDSTARTISVGDQVTVSGYRDGLYFNAQSILDANGQPLCAGTTSQ